MIKKIALVGGTGELGMGLACRLAASYEVLIGSRDASRAAEAAAKVTDLAGVMVTGRTNAEATTAADAAILAIPDLPSSDALLALKPNLTGKLVVSPIVPMEFRDGLFFPKPSKISAAETVESILQTRVAAAFHNVPAERLVEPRTVLDYDVMVAAETRETFNEAAGIVSSIPRLRPLYAGPLSNSRTLESLTPTLLSVGRLNKIRSPSIKIV
jgi:8-hydroxy-5-deazaflavin:NADPH oxidoreductase